MSKEYNKLVRDNIPDIIRAAGRSCEVRTLSEEEYLTSLEEKLLEETREYLADHTLEELADILEVVRALAAAHGADMERVEALRREKASQRGAFDHRVFLIRTL